MNSINVLLAPAGYVVSNTLGSEPTRAYDLIKNLALKGVRVVALTGYYASTQKIDGAKVIALLGSSKHITALRDGFDRAHFIKLYWKKAHEILQTEGIDVIHHFAPLERATFNPLALDGTAKKFPFVMGPAQPFQRIDFIDGFYHWMNVNPGLTALAVYRSLPLMGKILHPLFKKTVAGCRIFICASNTAKKDYASFVDPRKIVIIPNAVDTSLFRPMRTKQPKSPVVLTVGKLIKRKGIEHLILACKYVHAYCTDFILRIVGDGPAYAEFKQLSSKLGLEKNVEFIGRVPHHKLPVYYNECDLFCLPSLSDPFPNVLLEAMACGKPVVATAVGSVCEVLTNGKEGILIPPGDIKHMSEAILRLIRDDTLREKMSINALRTIDKKFSWNTVIERYIRVYRSLIR